MQIHAELHVTPGQIEQAEGIKAIGYVKMPCIVFLKLTTSLRDFPTYEDLTEGDYIVPFSKYEKRSKLHMPWMDILMDDGKLIGHEGRHRAASLLKEGVKTLPVAIRLFNEHRMPEYRYEWHVDGVRQKRYLGLDDIPTRWINQFGSSYVWDAKDTLKTFKWFYEGRTP